MDADKAKVINEILETEVRPKLHEHEGNIELVDIRNDIAYVRMLGHCSGCPSAIYTLESIVKDEILARTDVVKDVKLHTEVGDDLINFAKQILNKEVKF